MTPQNHLRVSVAIRLSFVFTGLALAVYSLMLSVPLQWWLPRLTIALLIITGFTIVGLRVAIWLIKVPCDRCREPMYEVNDSDPVAYQCSYCECVVKTDWERPTFHTD